MTRAGYDPEGAIRLMAILKEHSQGLPAFLSTHPATADREGAIRTLIAAHAEEWKSATQTRSTKSDSGAAPGRVRNATPNRTTTVYEEK
jgi:predicted Zn-dependent protease